jgi:hypothetical protein
MASALNVFLCAVAAALFWTCVGLPIVRRLAPERPLAWPLAPALGWAVHSAAALPILRLVGFSAMTVGSLAGIALISSVAALLVQGSPRGRIKGDAKRIPGWAYAGAALIALAPASAILPKMVDDGIILAAPIFDHSKVAIIDEIARLGLPPGNPFFGEFGDPSRLAYYYLWHFSAAELAVLPTVSGWEADAALTWFTAFSSLMLMVGLATWFSDRGTTAIWVLLFSTAAALRPVLAYFLDFAFLTCRLTGLSCWWSNSRRSI